MQPGALNHTYVLQIGPLGISDVVVTTWAIMLILWLAAWVSTRALKESPGSWQTAIEGIVSALEDAVGSVVPEHKDLVMPFVGTLWVYLVVANLAGLLPGLHAPTGNLSATTALAVLVFLSVHWFGIRTQGFRRYLLHYIRPNPILLPFHIISEITRTVALAVRLFGNMMSLEMAGLLVLLVAGLLAPVPILMLHVVEALVQAYLFGMLALIYIAGGLQTQVLREQEKE
ncbi:MAG TPA: F0F1 ATP synthase subunit A [Gammaproteobacteria bacterium]|nr:F0F1 ATP synthase subunit A [Gammaproteobacteria bacterium]